MPPPASELTFRNERRSKTGEDMRHLAPGRKPYSTLLTPGWLHRVSDRAAAGFGKKRCRRPCGFTGSSVLTGRRHLRKGQIVPGRVANPDFARAIKGLALRQ